VLALLPALVFLGVIFLALIYLPSLEVTPLLDVDETARGG
jgi:hypothetical protein